MSAEFSDPHLPTGPLLARGASGPGQPGERANFNAAEQAGVLTIRQIAHGKQGGRPCRAC
jgi:hypothetical protein